MRVTDFFPELLYPEDPRFTPQPPPPVDICAGPVYTVCVNVHWWSHISGQIMRLLRRDAWLGDDDTVSDAIQAIHKILDVGSATMGCGCGDTGLPRRFDDDGNLLVSYDDGVTWVPAPRGIDPRTNATIFPPLDGDDGDDKRCKGAANVKRHIENQAEKLIAELNAGGGISELIGVAIAILIFIGVIGTGGALTPLLMALCGALFAVGSSAFDAAMTAEVYAKLQCIVYCNMNDDASVNDSQFSTILSEISDQLDGIAAEYLLKTVQALGAIGLTNMARTASGEAADCSDCDCVSSWCLVYDFTTSDYGISFLYGSYLSGVGIVGTAAGSGVSIVGNVAWGVNTTITYFEISVTAANTCNVACGGNNGGGDLINENNVIGSTFISGNVPYAQDFDKVIVLNPSSGAAQGANVTMTRVEVRGTGNMPPGAVEC